MERCIVILRAFFSCSLALFFCICVVFLHAYVLLRTFFLLCALSLFCTFSSFCAFSLYLGFSPKLHPKLPVQQAPNTHLWLVPSHSGLLHVLPLCNELLSDSLNGLYLCDNCDLLCCYLFYGLCGQVREFVLCFCQLV
jgi:hypothetical protein